MTLIGGVVFLVFALSAFLVPGHNLWVWISFVWTLHSSYSDKSFYRENNSLDGDRLWSSSHDVYVIHFMMNREEWFLLYCKVMEKLRGLLFYIPAIFQNQDVKSFSCTSDSQFTFLWLFEISSWGENCRFTFCETKNNSACSCYLTDNQIHCNP